MTDQLLTARSDLTLTALLAALNAASESGGTPSYEEVAGMVATAATGLDLGKRSRHEVRTAASGVCIYLHLFAHGEPTDCVVEDGALLWSVDGLRAADLLSFVLPDSALVTTPLRAAARRLIRGGVDVVRFLKLTAPTRSLYVTDVASAPELLCGSPYWFGPEATSPDTIRKVLGGEL